MTGDRQGEKILVLGAGNFGTCLGQHLAEKGYRVTLWTRNEEVAAAINSSHKNPKYLSTINLSSRLSATSFIDENLLKSASVVLQALPTQSMRQVLAHVRPYWRNDLLLVCAAKGIELGTEKLPNGIISDVLGKGVAHDSVVLSGPSFASEIAAHQPTCVVVASHDERRAYWAQELFHATHFRVYSSVDPIGLEVAGALKNVVALAAGATVGMGFQMNSRAALITRGLAEITRIGVALGADPLTFKGLGGVGDLMLTCTSEKSRNFTVGYRLGRGEALPDIVGSIGSVAEGVPTAESAYKLSTQLGVDAPIICEVYKVLYEQKPIAQAVMDLLTREPKPEIMLPGKP